MSVNFVQSYTNNNSEAGIPIFFGLSTDPKPSSVDGAMFFEIDTLRVFQFEAGIWVKRTK